MWVSEKQLHKTIKYINDTINIIESSAINGIDSIRVHLNPQRMKLDVLGNELKIDIFGQVPHIVQGHLSHFFDRTSYTTTDKAVFMRSWSLMYQYKRNADVCDVRDKANLLTFLRGLSQYYAYITNQYWDDVSELNRVTFNKLGRHFESYYAIHGENPVGEYVLHSCSTSRLSGKIHDLRIRKKSYMKDKLDILKLTGVITYGKTLVNGFSKFLKIDMNDDGMLMARAIVFMLIVTILQLFIETRFISNFPKIKYQLDLMLKAITYYLVINTTEEVFEGLFGFLQDIQIDNIKEA